MVKKDELSKIFKNKKHQSSGSKDGSSKRKTNIKKRIRPCISKKGHPKSQQQTQHQFQPHFYPQSQFSQHEPNFCMEDQYNRNPYIQGPDPRLMDISFGKLSFLLFPI